MGNDGSRERFDRIEIKHFQNEADEPTTFSDI